MNFAIIGCGFIAEKHAKAIDNLDGAKLVAVCDTIPENMTPYVENYGAAAYENIEEMFKHEQIDVVCICTPTGSHAPIAVQVAQAKKHIILEKPIAMTLEGADRIIEACETHDVKLSIVHPNRYRPVVQELQKLLDRDAFGKISHANAILNWNRGQAYYDQSPWRGTKEFDGGALMNQAIHNVDLFLSFMGEIEEVFSMEATRLRNIEAEDVSSGVVRFSSGALGVVQAATTAYGQNFEESITIFGEKGTVKIGGKNALYFEHLEVKGMSAEKTDELISKIAVDPWGIPGHQRIIEDMIEAVKTDGTPTISGADGRRALELVLAFYESAEKNAPITLSKGESK